MESESHALMPFQKSSLSLFGAAVKNTNKTMKGGLPTTGVFKNPTLRTATGTRIQFWPDHQIFETLAFDDKIMKTRLEELSYLNPELKIEFINQKGTLSKFISKNGLIDYVDVINPDTEIQPDIIQFSGTEDKIQCFVALRWTPQFKRGNQGLFATTSRRLKAVPI